MIARDYHLGETKIKNDVNQQPKTAVETKSNSNNDSNDQDFVRDNQLSSEPQKFILDCQPYSCDEID